jgi:hypothetical protein
MQSSRSKTVHDKTLVFAGPTLSGLSEWRAGLSQSLVFHAPVKCGNVLEAFDEGYRRIVIVDGYFERVPAVWHKEIMHFMVRGGTCIGCSSMGALRAIELELFGMIGYGRVVEEFKSGRISDDDEVTVAHLDEAKGFVPLTDAMVNIRLTVADAVTREALDPDDAARILELAKSTFYKKRSLRLFASTILGEGPKHDRFNAYLETHGIIDQKRLDAVTLLENLDAIVAEAGPRTWGGAEPFHNTILLQTLQYTVNVNPPALDPVALSPQTRILKMGGLLVGHQYRLLVKLAGAMMHFSKHVESKPTPPLPALSWLDPRWFEEDDVGARLVALALEACPDYVDPKILPASVRYLALSIEYPIRYVDLALAPTHGTVLSSNATTNYSRLLYLLGLFLDARLTVDPLAKRLTPIAQQIDLREARYTLRGYETEQQQRQFLRTFGLDNLREAATHLERNALLLTDTDMGLSFGFFEEGVYWYGVAVRASGLWPQLSSLTKPDVRAAFSAELAGDLAKQPPQPRLKNLLFAGLPTNLLSAESIVKYIESQLGG